MTSPLVIRPEYLQAIGRIDAEWSTIEHVMLALFQMLMGIDTARAHAAFSELPSHRTRRDVLMRVAEATLAGRPELTQLRQIDRRLTRAARARNQIAHATWGLLDGDVVVLDPRANWAPQKVTLPELKEIEKSISLVYTDFLELIKVMRRPREIPLPDAAGPAAAPGGTVQPVASGQGS